jgi:hypothetical protein
MRPRQAVDQAGGGRSRTRRAAAQRRAAKAGLLASRGRRGHRAGEEGRRRRCGTGGPRQTRRERGPFRALLATEEARHRADDARQSASGAAIVASTLRALALSALIAATLMPTPAGAANGYDSGRAACVTDGDTDRLESGERISIAEIAPRKRIATRPNARARSCSDCEQRTALCRFSRGASCLHAVSVPATTEQWPR